MKAIEQYFPAVLFTVLYKVVLTFECVDEILKGDHSNESYRAVLSCGTVYCAVLCSSSSVCIFSRRSTGQKDPPLTLKQTSMSRAGFCTWRYL